MNIADGITQLRGGNISQAVHIFEQLSDRAGQPFPERRAVTLYLSTCLRQLGRHAEAISHAQKLAELAPNDPEVLGTLGLCQLEAGRSDEAEISFLRVKQLAPRMPFGALGLAKVRQIQGRQLEAISLFREAAALCPDSAPVLADIATALYSLDDAPTAETVIRRAHAAAPTPQSHTLLASILTEKGRGHEAVPLAQQAVESTPSSPDSWAVLGLAQQSIGQKEQSVAALLKSLELNPNQGTAWHALVQGGSKSQELTNRMLGVWRQNAISSSEKLMLGYALGQSLEALGRYEESFQCYLEANRLACEQKFGSRRFEANQYADLMHKAQAACTGKKGVPLAPLKSEPTPIFVFGMIRSGTTLVEKILSSHPEVGAGGEMLFWREYWREALGNDGKIEPTRLDAMRRDYLNRLKNVAPGNRWVVDKMPQNYEHIGIIAAAFPEAPMIHLTRSPGDNCFSILATANRSRLPFMHQLEAIPVAYQVYSEGIREWESLLPARWASMAYEDLVLEQDANTRALLAHCRISWDDACLAPESNSHQSATPSVVQVQRPIYQSSIGRCQPYLPFLPANWSFASNS